MTESPNPHIVDADSLTGEMHPIRRVVVALGSNLGERLASLLMRFGRPATTCSTNGTSSTASVSGADTSPATQLRFASIWWTESGSTSKLRSDLERRR